MGGGTRIQVHVRLEQKRQPIVHLMGAMGHSGSGVGHGNSGGWEHEHGSSGSGSKAIVGAATALVAAGGAAYGAYRWLKSSKKNNPDEKGGQPML
ncbi:hypothetical protein OC834_003267 [Tilletia horrida]|nr:hypothetical protein OC835_006870 [Tilletia horrida]KAK0530552.1 hypothetical protein OC834_003267 [Tilletia horrida]